MSDARTSTHDLVVIGGGAAGMTAARQVARAGKRVALIEADRTGGECLHTGCVPSKALLASARVAAVIRRAGSYGVTVGEPEVDLARVMARVERVIQAAGEADTPEALGADGVTVIRADARFIDRCSISIGSETLRAEQIVVATGLRPHVPSIPGLHDAGFVTHEQLFRLTKLPARLAVVGGGATGLELGQAFHRLGSQVTVIDHADRLLQHDDVDHAQRAQLALTAEGIDFHLGARVGRVTGSASGKRVTVERSSGEPIELEVDLILVATGREPAVDGLDLAAAGVQVSASGIIVDTAMRTTAASIWACGDVTGPPYITHVADAQARTVATGVLGGRSTWSDRAVPWVTFTDTEIAGVGLTEAAARECHGRKIEVLTLPYSRIDRALTDGTGDGQIKVLLAPGWPRGRVGGEIVGAHIVGANAGEIIQQLAFMMAWRLPAGMLVKTVQSYPTYSLGGRQALGLHRHRRPGTSADPSLLSRLLAKIA